MLENPCFLYASRSPDPRLIQARPWAPVRRPVGSQVSLLCNTPMERSITTGVDSSLPCGIAAALTQDRLYAGRFDHRPIQRALDLTLKRFRGSARAVDPAAAITTWTRPLVKRERRQRRSGPASAPSSRSAPAPWPRHPDLSPAPTSWPRSSPDILAQPWQRHPDPGPARAHASYEYTRARCLGLRREVRKRASYNMS